MTTTRSMRRGALYQGLWNLDLSDLDCRRALSDVEGQELESFSGAGGVDEPPDRVAAEEARGDRRLVTQWAGMTFERGKRDAAVSRVMLMLEQIAGHARRLAAPGASDIGEAPVDQAAADDA